MLVQNQTTFSASHVQAYWAHLDHTVYKNEVSEHKASSEAVAEKQAQSKWMHSLTVAKEQQRHAQSRMLSLTVDTKGQLEVRIVTVHSLSVASFASNN